MNFICRLLENSRDEKFMSVKDMPSLNKYNKGIKYLLCAIDLFSRYAGVVPWKVKRAVNIVNAFQKGLDSSTELHSKSNKANPQRT